ncbi:MAG: hypothetical protein IIC39_00780 [Candidatus Marinimicrobia bacterium]|nr:hypothetical protein [Candidatus Neomarinimicrobiota bacterium]
MDKLFIDSVEFLDNELMAESSSDIRNRIRENKGVDEFLDSKVINYIYDKKLYIN